MLFYLLVGHALADFVFQAGPMATEKSRHSRTELQLQVPWYYWLSAHSLIHGGLVAFITGSLALGIAETIVHWLIDYAKCEHWTSIHTDQLLHVLCKVLWWWLIVYSSLPLQDGGKLWIAV
jgi:hypothetical protein